MRSKAIIWTMIAVVGVVLVSLAVYLLEPAQQKDSLEVLKEDEATNAASRDEIPDAVFKDEPEARALYEKMIETMRNAESLSYKSAYREDYEGKEIGRCTYTIWMKKPNFFYVETINEANKNAGILIGDGQYAWSYWPNGRPRFRGEDNDAYEKSRFNVYMKEPAPLGKYSIGYAVVLQKSVGPMLINPSIFQGIKNTLEPVIDWMQNRGVEKVGDEDCNVIEVSYANHQRSQYFWISRRDNLPQKLKEIVRASHDIVTHELWSKVTLNAEIPMEKFTWTPPEDWQQWHPLSAEDKLLKPGKYAPDFELLSADGSKIKLSDYRGKVVWLNFWRVGCPPCREEIPYLEKLHRKYESKGLIVLGFDFADDRQIALDFLHQNSITFPNILDTSDEAIKAGFRTYGVIAAPVNYILDREGKIVVAWLGYEKDHKRAIAALEEAGLKLEGE